jgi:hypothetical protein
MGSLDGAPKHGSVRSGTRCHDETGREPGREPGQETGLEPGREPGREPGLGPGLESGLEPGREPGAAMNSCATCGEALPTIKHEHTCLCGLTVCGMCHTACQYGDHFDSDEETSDSQDK